MDFQNIQFLISAAQVSQFPPDYGAEVAFVGRSNVGKSSALNAITGKKSLARISKTPGRTQLINFFTVNHRLRLVDLPGYGFAKVSRTQQAQWQELVEAYLGQRDSLKALVFLMDSRHPLTTLDQQMLQWLLTKPCERLVLLTKVDKLNQGPLQQLQREIPQILSEKFQWSGSLILFSATKGTGVAKAVAWLNEALKE